MLCAYDEHALVERPQVFVVLKGASTAISWPHSKTSTASAIAVAPDLPRHPDGALALPCESFAQRRDQPITLFGIKHIEVPLPPLDCGKLSNVWIAQHIPIRTSGLETE